MMHDVSSDRWSRWCGRLIGRKFHLLQLLGTGNFGGVYAAEELVPDHEPLPVAVKLILPHAVLSRESQLEELSSSVHVAHPGILRAVTAGLDTLDDVELLYLVMERAESSLATRLAQGPLSNDEARALAEQLAEALRYLHSPPRRLVHCDVKPANILRCQGRWTLADFGIAQWLGAEEHASRLVFATRKYAPPEAARREITPAWDIWSLGTVLLEALTGQTATVPPDLPPALDDIIRGCLHFDVASRWSAESVLVKLSGESHVAVAEPVRHNLPPAVASFVGRDREQAELHTLLAHERLVTLTGAGGVGKTRLAVETASHTLPDFPDGAWMVQYAPMRNAALAAHALAAALSLPLASGAALDGIIDYLLPRRLLLILDNCEHLLATLADLARTLLRTCPLTRILATSREPLRVDGEVTYAVPTLDAPPIDPFDVSELIRFAAVRLFLDRAQVADPSFRLTEANAESVRQICAHLDGIPLAIELAAARLATLPVEDIAHRLGDRLRLLAHDNLAPRSHQQTLRVAIDGSYDLLGDMERALFRRLSVFTGGWRRQSAVETCTDAVLPQEIIPSELQRLVTRSLVLTREQGPVARYDMLETIRQYAADRLEEAGETARFREQAARHFLEMIENFSRDYPNADFNASAVDLARALSPEGENLRAALEYFLDRKCKREALRLTQGLQQNNRDIPSWSHAETLDCDLRAWQLPGEVPRELAINTLARIGMNIHALSGSREQTLAYLNAAERLIRESDEPDPDNWLFYSRLTIGELPRTPETLAVLNRKIDEARTWNNSAGYTGLLIERMKFAYYQGDFDTARADGRECVAFLRQAQSRYIYGAVRWLVHVEMASGRLEDARALLEEFLPYAQANHVAGDVGLYATLLQDIYIRQGEVNRARSLLTGLLEASNLSHSLRLRPQILCELGKLSMAEDHPADAARWFAESIAFQEPHLERIGSQIYLWMHFHQGDAERRAGRLAEARALFSRALERITAMAPDAMRECQAFCYAGLADLAGQENDFTAARESLLRSWTFRSAETFIPGSLHNSTHLWMLVDFLRCELARHRPDRAAILLDVVQAAVPPGTDPVPHWHIPTYRDAVRAVGSALNDAARFQGARMTVLEALDWVVNTG